MKKPMVRWQRVKFFLARATTLLMCLPFIANAQIGQPVQINNTLVTFGNVIQFKVNPAGDRVVYRADQETNNVFELYSTPIEDNDAIKLSGNLVLGGVVQNDFIISPDGETVVYRADKNSDDQFELFQTPINGGPTVRLNPNLVLNGSVQTNFQIDVTNQFVVYRADQETDDRFELYAVPLAGGVAVKLNNTLVAGGSVQTQFQISPDGERVVYRADQDVDGVFEIFSVPIDGSSDAINISDNIVSGGDLDRFEITQDSQNVVFIGDRTQNEVTELFLVPIDDTAPIRLNANLVAGGQVRDFAISPDSSYVVYLADQEALSRPELYMVAVGGGSPTKLNPDLVGTDSLVAEGFQISPNSRRVSYVYGPDLSGNTHLYSTLIANAEMVNLSVNLGDSVAVQGDIQWSANSEMLGYRAQLDGGQDELFIASIVGTTSRKISAPVIVGGGVDSFQIAPNSLRAYYIARQRQADAAEIYSVLLEEGAAAVRLNRDLPPEGNVLDFTVSNDSEYVIYRGDQDVANSREIYSVLISEVQEPEADGEFCFAVSVKSGDRVAAICL